MSKMVRILGVDPGSRLTGYGCVEVGAGCIRLITHGTLRLTARHAQGPEATMSDRLSRLFRGLSEVIVEHKPQVLVVENVFFAKNANSALKLGQARGVVILTAAEHGLDLHEYSATEVKKSIAGYGQADKLQVARVLQVILGKQVFDTPDASDGLALSVYHALAHAMGARMLSDELRPAAKKRSRGGSIADAVRHRTK